MEPRFGHDFSNVRVHTDARASESAHALNAIAYTGNSNIVFRQGYYKPGSTQGRRLIAHELTHVVQQRAGIDLRNGAQAGDAYERHADAEATRVAGGKSAALWLGRAMQDGALAPAAVQFQKGEPDKPGTRPLTLDPTSNPATGATELAKLRFLQGSKAMLVKKGVNGVLDTKANSLTIADNGAKKSVTVSAFTGGHVNCEDKPPSIISPGTPEHPLQIPAPLGTYNIVDNPNPKTGHEDWYGLFKQDNRMDDYFEDKAKERSGVRLHLGTVSHGCVTVIKCFPGADKKWKEIHDMINDTKKEKLKFIQGPHFWNTEGETTKYGTITIK